jgi:membrane protease YdiL (CAAX protease family)
MESKRYSAWADLGVMAAAFLGAALAAMVVVGAVSAMAHRPMFDPDTGMMTGAVMFSFYAAHLFMAILLGMFWYGPRGGVRLRLRASWADGSMVLLGVVLLTAASIVVEPLLALFPEKYLEQLNAMVGTGGWTILTTVVAAPILEEVFFRGLLLDGLSRRWNASAAVAASALLFGAAHLPILPQAVNAFVVAVVMGYIYLSTRSLIPVIVIHAINNGLAYLTLELTGSQSTDTRQLIGNDTIYWAIYAVSAVVLVVSLVIMAGKAERSRRLMNERRRRRMNERNKTGQSPLNTKTAAADE